jgi:hypothetical protein
VPELCLPADLGEPECGPYLLAVMLNPREPKEHSAFVEACENQVVLNLIARMASRAPPPGMMPLVARAAGGPRLRDKVLQYRGRIHAEAGYVRGEIAGGLLVYLLACAQHDPLNASMERVYHDLYRHGLRGFSRRQLSEIWREFKPAVHLWAALALDRPLWDQGRLAAWLALAESYRLAAEEFRPPKAPPVLVPGEAWRVPPRFRLPRAQLTFPRPEEIKAAL